MSPKGSAAARTRSGRATSSTSLPDWQAYSESEDLPHILFHSLDAFVANGYHATTVRDVARRLGQTVPAIYYYYENKQALLMALLSLSIDDLLNRCERAAAEEPDDPLARLSKIIRCIILYSTHRRKFALLDAEIRGLEPENRAEYVAKRDKIDAILTNAINDGIDAGIFAKGDARALSRAMLAMCRGVAGWYRTDGPLTPAELGDLYVMYALRLTGRERP
jgi:AcrR family transcriptional regulator